MSVKLLICAFYGLTGWDAKTEGNIKGRLWIQDPEFRENAGKWSKHDYQTNEKEYNVIGKRLMPAIQTQLHTACCDRFWSFNIKATLAIVAHNWKNAMAILFWMSNFYRKYNRKSFPQQTIPFLENKLFFARFTTELQTRCKSNQTHQNLLFLTIVIFHLIRLKLFWGQLPYANASVFTRTHHTALITESQSINPTQVSPLDGNTIWCWLVDLIYNYTCVEWPGGNHAAIRRPSHAVYARSVVQHVLKLHLQNKLLRHHIPRSITMSRTKSEDALRQLNKRLSWQ